MWLINNPRHCMHPYLTDLYEYGRTTIAGHRHRHFGIHHLILVLENSGTGMGLLIPVPDWFRHQHLKKPSGRKSHTWAPLRVSVVNKLKHYQNRGNKKMNDTYTALLCKFFMWWTLLFGASYYCKKLKRSTNLPILTNRYLLFPWVLYMWHLRRYL